MIAINQLLHIKQSLLSSQERRKAEMSDLDSLASLQPHLRKLLLFASGCVFTSIPFSLHLTFSGGLFLLQSKSVQLCHRFCKAALGLSVRFVCLAVVCG